MWLAFYNENVGDVLMLTRSVNTNEDLIEVTSQGNVTIIKDGESGDIVSVNIKGLADALKLDHSGQQFLSKEDLDHVNQAIQASGFDLEIDLDKSPKFVVGYVEELEAHEDSDHLSVTQTQVGPAKSLQIVCGASNIAQGQKILVALPGAVMPSGAIIWPGNLRGVDSFGMICSTRELNLTDIEDLPGIWELDDHFLPGTALEEVVDYYREA